ncbi:MAG TPA: DUF1800 domain-containing protein [Steroidobacteraceae bacterium]|jgi:uncharacterized protein (DUF1800 family)
MAAGAPAPLPREDVAWLNRITYGINAGTLAEYRDLGRRRYLQHQLDDPGRLPAPVMQQIAALEISRRDGASLLAEVAEEQKRINSLPEGPPRDDARKALNERGNALASEAARREALLAMYSSAQLQEQLVWFWLNHFNVHQGKANGRWLVGDYVQRAIRPHVLGKFGDLVLATLQHPAMLQYLDNAQNAVGHLNENYARELLELHTLGVAAGYSQQDVQQLTRILTGAGINAMQDRPRLKKEWEPLYRRDGAFEFNPARHDFGDKTLLGHRFAGSGFDEIQQAVAFIVEQPACARFISNQLASYFVADRPPTALVERMSKVFMKTHGDIRAVLTVMFGSHEFVSSLGGRFKDPTQFVIGSLRLAYDDKVIANTRPVLNWLNALGEPWFGRQTPDGYPLGADAWSSSGQMSRRFEIARAIGSGNAGLFQPEDGAPAHRTGFPQLSSRVYFDVIEPQLAADTRAALERAASQAEWNTLLLASPDFNYH